MRIRIRDFARVDQRRNVGVGVSVTASNTQRRKPRRRAIVVGICLLNIIDWLVTCWLLSQL